ncbi:unnamed protein product [Rhodiola kirilowii]
MPQPAPETNQASRPSRRNSRGGLSLFPNFVKGQVGAYLLVP